MSFFVLFDQKIHAKNISYMWLKVIHEGQNNFFKWLHQGLNPRVSFTPENIKVSFFKGFFFFKIEIEKGKIC